MTLIFGFNGLNEIMLVADSRVSFKDDRNEPQDILLKLYSFNGFHPPMTLGFCGTIKAIKQIMEYLSEHKLRDHHERYVVPEFAKRLRLWIEEGVQKATVAADREGLEFLLGGLEPGRPPKSFRSDGSYMYLGLPTGYLFKYKVNPSKGTVTMSSGGIAATIGSGANINSELEKMGMNYLQAGFGHDFAPAVRATILASDIASTYRRLKSRTVGGPFQLVRLTQSGHVEDHIFPPEENLGNADWSIENGIRQLAFPSKKLLFRLYSIYQLDLATLASADSAYCDYLSSCNPRLATSPSQ